MLKMKKKFNLSLLLLIIGVVLALFGAVVGGLYWGFSLKAMGSNLILSEPFNSSIIIGLMVPFYLGIVLLLLVFIRNKVYFASVFLYINFASFVILFAFIIHVFQFDGQTSHFKAFYETFAFLLLGCISLSSVMALLRVKAKKFRYRLHFLFLIFEAVLSSILIVLAHLYISSVAMLLLSATLLVRTSSYLFLLPKEKNLSNSEEISPGKQSS